MDPYRGHGHGHHPLSMAIIIDQLKIPLDADESSLKAFAARALAVAEHDIVSLSVKRVSLDARKKNEIGFSYTVEASLSPRDEARLVKKGLARLAGPREPRRIILGEAPLHAPVVVAGLGPAGLFAGYTLAKYGYRPILLERGRDTHARKGDVERFWAGGPLNEESNVMFGEGGAGAFSDGKLTTRIKDERAGEVVDTLARFGAPEEIRVMAKPHIGTDRLAGTVARIRQEIQALGGEVRFETRLDGLEAADGALRAVRVSHAGREERLPCAALILATGQGAADTYEMLLAAGFELVPKPFAAGVRIEHPRAVIDAAQYGAHINHPRLGAAEYHFAAQAGDRGVYTFCMCPGGTVVASSSSREQVVVNGMSHYARNGENSNAAIVVQVDARDFLPGPLGGLRFRQELERAAFVAGGGDYRAPACMAGDFLRKRTPQGFSSVRPTYMPGVKPVDLGRLLPGFMAEGVREGLRTFGKKLKGFGMDEAVITAVESRTSAPVRIVRDEAGEATRMRGVYPTGEGAGYAGGIVSAGVDGMRAAERIMARFRPD